MAKVLTDDSLTQEEAKIVARRAGAALKGAAKSMPKAASSAAQAGNDMLDPTLSSGSGIAGPPAKNSAPGTGKSPRIASSCRRRGQCGCGSKASEVRSDSGGV